MEEYLYYTERVNKQIRLMKKNFRNFLWERVRHFGFTIPQIMLILELSNCSEITLHELSDALGIAESTASGIVNRLEEQGVLTRIRPQDNRRIVKISLAPEFIKQWGLENFKNDFFFDIFKETAKEEIEGFIHIMEKVNRILERNIKNAK